MIIAIMLLSYITLQLLMVVSDGYSVNSLASTMYGYIGLLISIAMVVIAIIANKDFAISKEFMITIFVFSVILLLQNISIMQFLYEKTYDFDRIHRFIYIISSQTFAFKDVIYLLAQVFFIDQLVRK